MILCVAQFRTGISEPAKSLLLSLAGAEKQTSNTHGNSTCVHVLHTVTSCHTSQSIRPNVSRPAKCRSLMILDDPCISSPRHYEVANGIPCVLSLHLMQNHLETCVTSDTASKKNCCKQQERPNLSKNFSQANTIKHAIFEVDLL